MNKFICFIFLLLIFTSCGNKYKIEGSSSFSGFDGKMLYVKTIQDDEWVAVDSAEIIHGLFSMKGKVDSITMATLFMDDESIMPIVLENGMIRVQISYPQFSARGTPMNNTLYDFIEKHYKMELEIEELERKEARMVMEGINIDDIRTELNIEEEKLNKDMEEYVKRFISDNYENVLGPNVFVMLCSTLPYPILTPQIEDILNNAPYSFKNHKLVKDFVSKAKTNMEQIKEQQRLQYNSLSGNRN